MHMPSLGLDRVVDRVYTLNFEPSLSGALLSEIPPLLSSCCGGSKL